MIETFQLTDANAQQFVLGQLQIALARDLPFKTSIESCVEHYERAYAAYPEAALLSLHKACQYAWGAFPPPGIRVIKDSRIPFKYEVYLAVSDPRLDKLQEVTEPRQVIYLVCHGESGEGYSVEAAFGKEQAAIDHALAETRKRTEKGPWKWSEHERNRLWKDDVNCDFILIHPVTLHQ